MTDYTTHIISEDELSLFIRPESEPLRAMALLRHQIQNWALAGKNFSLFGQVEQKELSMQDGSVFFVQHNPERIRSAAAKVDQKSLSERPCFLCGKHLPEAQKGIKLFEKYLLLVNPFPIFKTHFTIPSLEHTEQRYEGRIRDFLSITRELKGLTLLYNGAKCGASAPDHFHFQAFGEFDLPVFGYKTQQLNERVLVGKYPFAFVKLVSDDLNQMDVELNGILKKLKVVEDEEEPRLNLLCRMVKNQWELILIPRTKHRAASYFNMGEEQILVSPGAVDFSIVIAPRKEDFEKLDGAAVMQIMEEVTLPFEELYTLLVG